MYIGYRGYLRKALLALAGALGVMGAALAQPLPQGASQPAPGSFYDLPETHWAHDAVAQLSALGVLTGYPDGRFDGTRAATRYELATVAARLLEQGLGDGAAGLGGRVGQLEQALSRAASAEYAQSLEARVAALEAALSAQGGAAPAAGADAAEEPAPAAGVVVVPAQEPPAEPPARPSVAAVQNVLRSVTGGTAVAEGVRFSARPAHPFYVGLSPGIVSTAGDVYLSVQAGYDGLIGPVGPAARLTFNGGNQELRVALDALARAEVLLNELQLYGGLGVGATVRPTGGSLLLEAPFGGEYLVTPRLGLYLQLTTSYGFAPVNEVDAELSTGFNLRF